MPAAKPKLTDCFERKIAIDRMCRDYSVVKIEWIKARRRIRRECQVFLLGPAGGGIDGGGSPVAVTG